MPDMPRVEPSTARPRTAVAATHDPVQARSHMKHVTARGCSPLPAVAPASRPRQELRADGRAARPSSYALAKESQVQRLEHRNHTTSLESRLRPLPRRPAILRSQLRIAKEGFDRSTECIDVSWGHE